MKRWSTRQKDHIESPEADLCIEEVIAVLRKHNFILHHEDSQGGFLLTSNKSGEYNEFQAHCEEWFKDAAIDDYWEKYRKI